VRRAPGPPSVNRTDDAGRVFAVACCCAGNPTRCATTYCGHNVSSPEIAHLIRHRSRRTWPTIRKTSAGPRRGKRRCAEPPDGCGLACNTVAAGNVAPRGADGRSLPFPPSFLAAKIKERQTGVRQSPGVRPASPPPASGRRGEDGFSRATVYTDAGRPGDLPSALFESLLKPPKQGEPAKIRTNRRTALKSL